MRRGFSRDDLFTCVHEQFLTDTARHADIVLPATMFLEHDDIYTAGGHQYLQFGGKAIEPPEGCRSNHEVLCALAKRLGAEHPGFEMSAREMIDATLRASGRGTLAELEAGRGLDCQPPFEDSHFLNGFAHKDRKFHFHANWPDVPFANDGLRGAWQRNARSARPLGVNEAVDEAHPFKLATSPARNFLNSSFNQTATSLAREARPTALMHPDDAAALGLAEGDIVRLGNTRGNGAAACRVCFPARARGVIVSEGLWDNADFLDGRGINTLTGDDSVAPFGGAAFHDVRVWAEKVYGGSERAMAETEAVAGTKIQWLIHTNQSVTPISSTITFAPQSVEYPLLPLVPVAPLEACNYTAQTTLGKPGQWQYMINLQSNSPKQSDPLTNAGMRREILRFGRMPPLPSQSSRPLPISACARMIACR